MKNKKGFTLIELLAVIVILAVIMVIAVPKIINIIENSEKKSYENSVNLMVEAARLKYQTGNIKGENIQLPLSYIYEDNKQTNIEEVGELVFKGDKPFSGTITITEEGKIVVENLVSKNKKWCALKEQNNAEAKVGDASELGCAIEEVDNDNYLIKATNSDASNPYLNGPIKKEEIESIKFERSKKVPSDAINSWDVSKEQNESIMAWYKDSDNDSLYELYIGQNGGVKANRDSSNLFRYLKKLTNIDLSNFDTTNVTDMGYMFYHCDSLTSLDVSNFNTSKVKNMADMFDNCSSLTSLNVSNFDTSNVEYMNYMFSNCLKLINLDVSSFDTSNVEYMTYMFYECKSLTNIIGLDKFNTSKVIYMIGMFYGCSSLTSLNVSNFDTSNVERMYQMFSNCSSLTNLDLSNFDTSKVTDMGDMFRKCSSLTNLNLGEKFDTTKVTKMSYMFYDSPKIITEFTVRNPNVTDYSNMFGYAATELGSKITVNYTSETESLVTSMINTKSKSSNVVKGVEK